MHAESEKLNPAEIATLLRGDVETISAWSGRWNARRFALHVAVILLGAGCYGAAMGWWRDPQQALFTAVKFPLIILLTTAGNALINAMLAPLLGLNIPFRQSFSAILMSFTSAATILGAFSPVVAFMVWNAPPMSPQAVSGPAYSLIKLTHVAVIAFAGTTGNARLFQLLARLARQPRGRVSRAGGVAGRKSFSRQPVVVDPAPVHRVAGVAGGIFPRDGAARKFLRKCFPFRPASFPGRLNPTKSKLSYE